MLLVEWGVKPPHIEEHWTNSLFFRMVDAFVKRKKAEADAMEGKSPQVQQRREQIVAEVQVLRSFGAGEYPLLKSKRVASGS